MRMYDRLWRYPEDGQVDREIFRRAAARIRELGRQGPFIATLISASNHHPFRSLEPALDVAGQGNGARAHPQHHPLYRRRRPRADRDRCAPSPGSTAPCS